MTPRERPPQLAVPRGRLAGGLFAALGAPVAWMADLLVSYAASDVLCDAGSGTTSLRTVLAGVSVLALLTAVAAALVAASIRRRTSAEDPTAPERGRYRMFGTVGLLTSLIFGVAISMTLASALFAQAC